MKQKTKTQLDYTAYEVGYQLRISQECDVHIPKDDPVRLLSAIMDRLDYSPTVKSQVVKKGNDGTTTSYYMKMM